MRTFHHAKLCLPVGLAALMLSLTATARAQFAYDITPIAGSPSGLNNLGQVVGYYFPAGSNVAHAFEYSDGQFKDLFPHDGSGVANAINDNGLIAGGNETVGNYVYNSHTNKLTPISVPTSGYSYTSAINQNGDVTGAYQKLGTYAYIYSSSAGAFQNITRPDSSYTTGAAINNLGQVTGETVFHNPNSLNAYLYSNGVTQNLGSVPGYSISSGTGINDSGEVVGIADSTNINLPRHAFFYKNGVMNDLGALINPQIDSFANGINNAGDIVGRANGVGFLYHNGQVEDLNSLIDPSLGWSINSATAINNNGQIIGVGNRGGFLMTPRAVPAPGSLLTCAVGGVLFLASRRRRPAT